MCEYLYEISVKEIPGYVCRVYKKELNDSIVYNGMVFKDSGEHVFTTGYADTAGQVFQLYIDFLYRYAL